MSAPTVGQIDWSPDYESAKQKLSESEFRAVVLENKTLASVRADRDKAFRNLQTARDRIEELESQVRRLEAKVKCPDSVGGRHRWDGDGQCKDCCNYATDLIDAALTPEVET